MKNVLVVSDATKCITSISALIAVACTIVSFRNLDSNLSGAFYGWSPTALMANFWSDPAFAVRNYPGGEEELLKSAAFLPLRLVGAVGVPSNVVFPILLALEVIALAAGAIVAVRRLVRFATISEAVLTAVFLVAGTLASGNLARWGHPYYGSVYNYAYGAGLAGIALLLTGNVKRGFVFLALTYVIHPVLGMFFGVFAAAGTLANLTRYRRKELWTGVLIFAATSAVWTLYSMRGAGVSGGDIPADAFVTLTKIMGYHWYPVTHGIFGHIAYERFVPFLSVCLLTGTFLFQCRPLRTVDLQVIAGLVVLGVVTLLGILGAELSGTPFVIKLALHRASAVLLLIGSLFVVPGLFRYLESGTWWRAVPAAAIIASVFVDPYGPPLMISLLLTIFVIAGDLRLGLRPNPTLLVILATIFASVSWLMARGYPQVMPETYVGLRTIFSPVFLGILIALLVLRATRLLSLAPIAVGLAACIWATSLAPLPDATLRAKADTYLDIQRWAKTNTAPGSLFIVDPGHAYGWREYSERPSFGNVREWLYAGWIYNSKREVYDAGLARLSFFGISMDELLRRQAADPDYGKARLAGDLQKFYYRAGIDWFKKAVHLYGVDYFVMDETMAADVVGLETVYRNAGYSVRRLESAESRQ